MTKQLLAIGAITIVTFSCTQKKATKSDLLPPATTNTASATHKGQRITITAPSGGYSRFIPVDSANKMISSYLNSIHAQSNDSDLRSLVFNADSLITYLTSSKMSGVKLMFAHTLEYINNGGKDQYAGYQSGALTLVVAGYDSTGHYVFYTYGSANQYKVLENSMPCPTSCPSGPASNDLIIN